jgi:predicted ATP-grasp superfamily ATP-dependent carboligase
LIQSTVFGSVKTAGQKGTEGFFDVNKRKWLWMGCSVICDSVRGKWLWMGCSVICDSMRGKSARNSYQFQYGPKNFGKKVSSGNMGLQDFCESVRQVPVVTSRCLHHS